MTAITLIIACAIAVGVLLIAEYNGISRLKWAAKPAASLLFVLLALASGASESGYGVFILAGLVFCLIGDVFLIPDSKKSFLAGMAAFGLGHSAYIAAFLTNAADVSGLFVLAATAMALLSAGALRWLWPKLGALKWPVAGYSAIIAVMASTSVLAAPPLRPAPYWPAIIGAFAFAISDLAVARDQFIARNFFNRLWGLPLYYGGQLLLAASV